MSFKITVQQLMRALPSSDRAKATEFVDTFNVWAEKFQINTIARACHFITQVAHESGNFKYVEENLNYSAERLIVVFPRYFNRTNVAAYARQPEKIANKVYANRMGNGSEASGDGWKYRGRGFIQLTGRSMYQAYQNSGFCNGALIYHPEWLTKAPGHTKSAMWYWWKNGLNQLADLDYGDGIKGEEICKQITKKVNGAYNGLSNRLYIYRRMKKELGL